MDSNCEILSKLTFLSISESAWILEILFSNFLAGSKYLKDLGW